MSEERYPVTPEGYEKLRAELDRLERAQRPETVAAVAEARSHGDLSENAEYHAARERLRIIDSRIAELSGKIARADVIDPAGQSGDAVRFGARVKVYDGEADAEREYQIVGEDEADADLGRISIRAPLARALIGKRLGDEVELRVGDGERYYEILEVEFG